MQLTWLCRLNHLLDYWHMDTEQLAAFGLKYSLDYNFHIWYEVRTYLLPQSACVDAV